MTEPVIRVLVVDDHVVFGSTLARTLSDGSQIAVVGAVTTIPEALDAVRKGVDVVLCDFRLADGDGVALTRMILDQARDVRVVMLTASSDDAVMAAAIDAGCAGFITKGTSLSALVAAVRGAAAGESVITPALRARLLQRLAPGSGGPDPDLTPGEREVMTLIVKGDTNQQISAELLLSYDTVRDRVASILTKLDAHTKLHAAAIAVQRGLSQPPAYGCGTC